MNLDSALTKARTVTAPKAAGRLYLDIESELALGEPTAAQEHQAYDALSLLEERFPNIRERADTLAEEHVPALSRAAVRNAYPDQEPARSSDNTRRSSTTSDTREPGAAVATPPARRGPLPAPARQRVRAARAVRTRSSSSGGSRRSSSPVRQAARYAGQLDQATGSWGSDAWAFVVGGIGLSLLYLVLTHPQGLSRLMTGTTNLISWITDPTIDPLRPTTTGATK